MRIAIFGDIHANLEALQAVLEDASRNHCKHFACIGDVVGYNADPHECLECVRELGCPVVKGNHDEDAAQDTPLVGVNPLAKQAMEWTRANLDGADRGWLDQLPMVAQVEDFTIVHATLDTPEGWCYVTNEFDAMSSFSFQQTKICFYGHTHTPIFYVLDGHVSAEPLPEIEVEPEKRYFINVGSVGQPRDGDWRACYAIYDIDRSKIIIRRVDYDVGSTKQKLHDSGLPSRILS
jgi:diadenosine tetraphosphatase ApaH/serine/threonine PP2A family protein phosphatase